MLTGKYYYTLKVRVNLIALYRKIRPYLSFDLYKGIIKTHILKLMVYKKNIKYKYCCSADERWSWSCKSVFKPLVSKKLFCANPCLRAKDLIKRFYILATKVYHCLHKTKQEKSIKFCSEKIRISYNMALTG